MDILYVPTITLYPCAWEYPGVCVWWFCADPTAYLLTPACVGVVICCGGGCVRERGGTCEGYLSVPLFSVCQCGGDSVILFIWKG